MQKVVGMPGPATETGGRRAEAGPEPGGGRDRCPLTTYIYQHPAQAARRPRVRQGDQLSGQEGHARRGVQPGGHGGPYPRPCSATTIRSRTGRTILNPPGRCSRKPARKLGSPCSFATAPRLPSPTPPWRHRCCRQTWPRRHSADHPFLEWGRALSVRRPASDLSLLGWAGDNGDPDNFLSPNPSAPPPSRVKPVRWCDKTSRR